MDATQVLGLICTILALITGLELRIKDLVKHYLSELKPNGGGSVKDQLTRIERHLGIGEDK